MASLAGSLITGGVGAFSAWSQHKAQQQALNQQQQVINKTSSLADTLSNYSSDQYQLGKPALSTAIGMYTKLASGNRGEIQGAIAPDVARATEAASGVGNYLNQQGIRGGVRDTQLAENQRQLAGNIGMMPFLARQNAIQNLGQLGSQTTAQGLSGMNAATSAMGSVAGLQQRQGQMAFNQGEVTDQHISDFGESLAGMIVPYLNQQKGGGGSGNNFTGVPFSFGTDPRQFSGWSTDSGSTS